MVQFQPSSKPENNQKKRQKIHAFCNVVKQESEQEANTNLELAKWGGKRQCCNTKNMNERPEEIQAYVS